MAGWHEDFEDEPSVEERFPDVDVEECDCMECESCSERLWDEYEREQDEILAQQELEDYEGLSWNEDYNDAF